MFASLMIASKFPEKKFKTLCGGVREVFAP
jgi:hypothetical protein